MKPAQAGTDQPFHISELCSALGLGPHTLHRAFHDMLGAGPVAYLRLRRLSSVRWALRTADPQASITQTARDHGLTEAQMGASKLTRSCT